MELEDIQNIALIVLTLSLGGSIFAIVGLFIFGILGITDHDA